LATLGRVKLALVVVALLVVSGCGQEERGTTSSGASRPDTELTVTIGAPAPATRHISCPGSPDCGRLAQLDVEDFKRDTHRACTQQYGGDGTAKVTGTLHGRPLQTDFSLRDGCEISRWQQFAWLLGKRLPRAIAG
jgi:hypothetical protein